MLALCFVHYKSFQLNPTININFVDAHIFNLRVVVANQRLYSLRSKCCIHLMSTMFPCYIQIQTGLYSDVALESLERYTWLMYTSNLL